jgi:DNA mismatch repair protein MutL
MNTMTIKILADEVASQIAAGEVVERPASVVKELLENAIDAGSDRITIRVEEAGRKLIEVSDNGNGITIGDLPLAVCRHATSKLQTADDLFHVRTLGFRGEALAAIGSVSRMTILSRNTGSATGAKIVVEGGKIVSNEPVGGTIGTIVRVEDLFFNTPARLKFIKRDQTEKQQIDGLVTRYALAYPENAIRLVQDENTVLHTTGNGDRREILVQMYGVDLARQLLVVVFEEEGLKITGFTSPISVNRSNRRDITFFVNGRWIQDTALSTALIKAYQTYLMVGRYPLAVLFLDVVPEEVDVNVHPAKAEVRFRQPDVIFTSVQRAIRRALMAYSPIPQLNPVSWKSGDQFTENSSLWSSTGQNLNPQSVNLESLEIQNQFQGSTPTSPGSIPLLRLIGQIGSTYLVAEGPDGLYLIDQHAAHERVLYEKMINMHGSVPSQALLEPKVINMPPMSAGLLRENLEIINHIGFQLEEFGINTFRLSAMPSLFGQKDPQAAIRSVVEDFEEDETPLQGKIEEKMIARICKRMAVKGGATLSLVEQRALLRDLELCDSPRTCPHGRPTMIHLSVDLLERQFGRRGARSS